MTTTYVQQEQRPGGWADHALGRCNAAIRPFAERLRAAGKPFKVIVVACMRKLLTILNVMIRENQPWQPRLTLQKT